MPVSHCQHGVPYRDPDGPCDQCLSEHPRTLPDWSMVVWRLKAEMIILEYRIAKLEASCQSRT